MIPCITLDSTTAPFIDCEEEYRELMTISLQQSARSCINEITMIDKEIEMLRFRDQLEQSKTSDGPSEDLNRYKPEKYENRKGLSVTRYSKVGNQLITDKQTIKAGVFRETVAAPTMTIEQYGEALIQQQQLQQQQQQQQQQWPADENSKPVKKYKQLLADGEEDNLDLVDKAVEEDRKWDDFCDNNPKGIGNKMNKRF